MAKRPQLRGPALRSAIVNVLSAEMVSSVSQLSDLIGVSNGPCAEHIDQLEADGLIVQGIRLCRQVRVPMTGFMLIPAPDSIEGRHELEKLLSGSEALYAFFRVASEQFGYVAVVSEDLTSKSVEGLLQSIIDMQGPTPTTLPVLGLGRQA